MSDAQVEAICSTVAGIAFMWFMYKFSRND